MSSSKVEAVSWSFPKGALWCMITYLIAVPLAAISGIAYVFVQVLDVS